MSFGIRCNFSRIQSYADAVTAWEEAVIFPKSDHPLAPRGLVDRRKKHLTIERTETGDIILRLYWHPTVTWHKDNSLTICAYSTKSTGIFANHCTPASMYVTASSWFRVRVDGRTYRVDGQITFRQRDNTWKADQITPWSISVVNRARANLALEETNYKEFRLWLKVYVQMAKKPDGIFTRWVNDDTLIEMLRARKWRELIEGHFPDAWNYPDLTLHKVRQKIYNKYKCTDHKSVPFLG